MSNFYGNVCQKCGLYISSSTRSCPRCKNYCTNITKAEDEYDFYADTGLYDSGNSDDNLFLSLLLDSWIDECMRKSDYNPPFESKDYSKGYHDPDDYVTRHYDYDDYGDEDDEPTEMEEWVMHEWEIDNVDDGR